MPRLPILVASVLTLAILNQKSPAQILPEQELLVRHVSVVEDPVRTAPGGCWHFGTMLRNIAGDQAPGRFTHTWLQTLITPQTVNGVPFFDPARAAGFTLFRDRWPKLGNGLPDVDQSPFRLLAIVNRPDLLQVGPNGPTSFGECRFVYGAFDPLAPAGQELLFVIFEFDVPAAGCAAVKNLALAWHAMGSLALPSPAFNAALQTITDSIVQRQPGSLRINQSNLKQLRSNEFGLLGSNLVWELREWHLVPNQQQNDGALTTTTTKQQPWFSFLGTAPNRQILADYLQSARPAILAGTHVVPDHVPANGGLVAFQAGSAINTCSHPAPANGCTISNAQCGGNGTKWWAPGFVPQCNGTVADGEVRHKFALQTCAGCHGHETGAQFTHISHRAPGQASNLSKFLTGVGYPIPDLFFGAALPHSFNDLQHRATVLQRMTSLDCAGVGANAPGVVLSGIRAETGSRVH